MKGEERGCQRAKASGRPCSCIHPFAVRSIQRVRVAIADAQRSVSRVSEPDLENMVSTQLCHRAETTKMCRLLRPSALEDRNGSRLPSLMEEKQSVKKGRESHPREAAHFHMNWMKKSGKEVDGSASFKVVSDGCGMLSGTEHSKSSAFASTNSSKSELMNHRC